MIPDTDPRGRPIYWFTVFPLEEHAEGTDLWAIQQGFVSITPLELDLTDHDRLADAMERVPDPTGDRLAAQVR